jgi:hypothetical protein
MKQTDENNGLRLNDANRHLLLDPCTPCFDRSPAQPPGMDRMRVTAHWSLALGLALQSASNDQIGSRASDEKGSPAATIGPEAPREGRVSEV